MHSAECRCDKSSARAFVSVRCQCCRAIFTIWSCRLCLSDGGDNWGQPCAGIVKRCSICLPCLECRRAQGEKTGTHEFAARGKTPVELSTFCLQHTRAVSTLFSMTVKHTQPARSAGVWPEGRRTLSEKLLQRIRRNPAIQTWRGVVPSTIWNHGTNG